MKTENLLEKIYDIHDIVCNQRYGNGLPYSYHLKEVVAQVEHHIGSIIVPEFIDGELQYDYNSKLHDTLVLSAAGHDLIEDARTTYNDIIVLCSSFEGKRIADIIYCCTEEKGRNRNERHSDKYFKELSENREAVFVKLCDIIANAYYSKVTASSMFYKYVKEYPKLRDELYIPKEYDKVWENLELILF